ncbi:6233_t:CDS:2, partial [Gigaspora margarita]
KQQTKVLIMISTTTIYGTNGDSNGDSNRSLTASLATIPNYNGISSGYFKW